MSAPPAILAAPPSADAAPPPSLRPPLMAALALIAALVGATGGWAMWARLDAAVVLDGVVLAETRRKPIAHPEGGVLEALLVRPGARVAAGQPVARLDAVRARAELAELEAEAAALSLRRARLDAERAGAPPLDLAAEAAALGRPELGAPEAALDAARRAGYAAQVDALVARRARLGEEADADAAQAESAARQAASMRDERARIGTLVARGAAPAMRLFELDRAVALLEGEEQERRALAAAARSGAAETAAQIAALLEQRLAETGEEAAAAARRLDALAEQIPAVRDRLERHVLRAPEPGRVVDVRPVGVGGVLAPGATLMEITPDEDRLVIEARMAPEAIDTVYVGRRAEARLVAWRRSDAPVAQGEVIHVSPDLIEDPRDGSKWFLARVALDPDALAGLPGVALAPGMPVEIVVATGARSAGDYVLEPFLRHMRRAFREE